MSSTPEFNDKQLAAARAKAWHQDGEQLLTLEAAREWLDEVGLVFFAPRPQLAAPAPSLVEATLGVANDAPTLAQTQIARDLTARLLTEGAAVPLNLLGSLGDAPDYVASTQVFSYVFTLLGDKAWKQAPSTSGTTSVSPLALAVYESLTSKGAQTAAELANELGREVTEAAIQRALTELWSQLRVVPQLQHGDEPSMWELTTQRFTKAMKAGANAGQPRALSALISLYLSQAYAATEEEAEIFLSPLTARSRVREVLHALTAARQLETVVLEGKTLLYIPGTLPEFPATEGETPAEGEATEEGVSTSDSAEQQPVERIRRFQATDRKPAFRPRTERTDRPAYPARDDRERRPFRRPAEGEARPNFSRPKPDFTKPWSEDRKPAREFRPRTDRPAAGGDRERRPYRKPEDGQDRPKFSRPRPEGGKSWGGDRKPAGEFRSRTDRPARPAGGERRPYRKPEEGGDRPKFSRPRPEGGKSWGGDRGPAREFRPRTDRADRPARPASAGAERRPYRKPEDGQGRPSFSRPRSDAGKSWGGDRKPAREFRPRTDRPAGDGERRPYRKPEGGQDRPSFSRPRPAAGKSWGGDRSAPRGESSFRGERKEWADRKPRYEGTAPERVPEKRSPSKPDFPRKPRAPRADAPGDTPSFSDKPSFGDKPKFGGKPSFGKKPAFGNKPAFGSKPAFGKKPAFGSKPGGKFSKPASAGKKFGSKPPARRPKPRAEE